MLPMKITVLVDNNTLIDHYFIGEPAASYFIEADGKRILFDVGYSDAFVKNAQKLKIDLLDLDYLVLSHGHLDHMWGLDALLRMYSEASLEGLKVRKPTVIAHPKTFFFRPRAWLGGSGSLVSQERVSRYFDIQQITEPTWLTDRLVCLPNIPKSNDFELQTPFKQIRIDGKDVDDYVEDEIAIAYKLSTGLVISNPCSHRGICNTIEYAKTVCKDDRIADVVCGFHLQNPDKQVLDGAVAYFAKNNPAVLHPGHCTDLRSKVALSSVAKLEEMGSGLQLTHDS
jgi:7,8-dihydropterin-6-yl-methyl-4-(beta-D-ribofuranosyl)aminobenzene 5'-phosphate synthase